MMSTAMPAERRSGCPVDLIGQMIESPVSAEMTAQEMTASVVQLVFAGNETTAKLMGTTLYALARNGKGLVAGVQVPDGATVLVLQGAANRDPARWENPDVLDVRRTPRSHLGFGFGMHHCLGISLARLELEIWLNRRLDEIPDCEVFDLDWGRGWVARCPVRLTIGI